MGTRARNELYAAVPLFVTLVCLLRLASCQVSYMATDILFPEWKIWTQFLDFHSGGLCEDALEQSHPIEVRITGQAY